MEHNPHSWVYNSELQEQDIVIGMNLNKKYRLSLLRPARAFQMVLYSKNLMEAMQP
jgi:hypothetical protein